MTSSAGFVEEKDLILPNLENGPYAIGDLWNCHDSTCIGSNIFGKTLNRDFVEAVPIDHLQYTLSHVKGAKDRMKTLQVAGEVSLELLGGLISGTLGGSYADEQTTSLMEEELQCKYDLVTNNVRVKPEVKEHLNQTVVKSILKGELKATHVVEAEIIGAKVIASIHLKDSKGSEKEDIKGSFMGKLGYGKISLKAKADLCKLDSQTDDQFEVNISLDSKPAPQTQPVSVTEMFKVIEDIMERVKTMTHPAFIQSPQNGSGDGRHIYGIPIRFRLVPITRFLDVQIEKLYRSIHDDTVENFAELLSFLKNIQVHGFLPQRILGSEYRLARLLRDKKNKVTQRIRVREEEFRLLAQDYYKEAVNELKKYKIGKSGYEDLVSLITKINRGVNEPMILEVVEILVEEGREELRAVKLWPSSSDSTPPQTSLTILSNMEHMKEWLPGSGELRVLLRTDRIADFGVVKTLQCISSGLKKIRGIEVGMALPSVSGDGGGEFKLTLQCLRLQSGAHSEHSEEYSTAKDIVFAVRILSFLANEADVNSVKFFGTLLNQMNLKLSSLNSSGSNLLDIIRRLMKYKGITIVDTEVRFQDLCTQKDGRWKLAVTVGAVDSAYENVVYCQKYYERFCGLQMPLDWIIGHFGFESVSQFAEAPVMFVFKDGELKGICLDNFEILLLMEALQTSGDQQEIFFKSYLEANRNRSLRHRSFNAEVSKFALKVAQLFGTRAVDSSEGEHMTLFPPPESDPILSELRHHLRVIVDEAEVQNTAELQLVKTKLASVKEMITAKRLAVPSSMKTKLDFYLNNGNLFEETKNSPHDLLRLLNLISKLLTNSGLLALHGCIDAFSSLEDEDATCRLIGCFVGERFTPDQTCFLIGSCAKIRLLMERNVTRGRGDGSRNLKVLREIVRVFCVEGVPKYFPESVKQAIEASGVLPRNRGQDAIEVFETIDQLYDALRLIDETGVLPRHFHGALLNTVTEKPEIKSVLQQSECLLHWDSQSNNFDELWGHATVQRVRPRLHNFLYNHTVPSSIEDVRLSTAVAFFPELKPPQEFQKLQGDHAETTYENPSGLQMGGINVLEKLSGNHPGSSNRRIIPKTFMQAGHVLQRPELSKDDIAKDGYMAKIFPFILQRLKMWGAHNIGQVEMASLHPYASLIRSNNSNGSETGESSSAEPQKSRGFKKKKPEASSMMKSTKKQTAEDKRCPISRLDMLAYLWVNCHGLVFRDLMKILSMFPVSLPLIVPNLLKSSTKSVPGNPNYICLLPLLRDATFKWKIDRNTDERIYTNQLFQNPFKMIVCVRLGEGKGSNGLGKSTILNQLFKDRATFSCRNDPGAEYGKPLTLDGSVELVVLNENTCSSSLWNEAVVDHYQQANQELLLLANLHGNILQHPDIVQILKRLASYFIVFVMPMSETDLEAYSSQLEEILECGDEESCRFNNRMSLIFVDAEKDILEEYPLTEYTHVNTGQLTSDSTLKSVRTSLRNPLNLKSLTNSLTLTEAEFQISPALSFVPELIHHQSHILTELIQSQNCAKFKSHLKLQQMNYRSPGVECHATILHGI